MSQTRTEFTDSQKAKIFVRDRATCCFSGANLWLLDTPLRPGHERDWVDHIRPSSRLGKSDEYNGVCASHTFNAKKRNNSSDNVYLFREGIPTVTHFGIFGALSAQQHSRLQRLSHLLPEDWYFNRAIGLVFLAFEHICSVEWGYDAYSSYERKETYWFSAAWKKLQLFQNLKTSKSLESRGIIIQADATTDAWLSLRTAATEIEFQSLLKPLQKAYRSNFRAWNRYFHDSKTPAKKRAALKHAENAKGLSGGDTLRCIREDFALRPFSAHQ
jgi:hypothetical protein